MFIIILSYKQPIEVVNHHLEMHRTFLDECYKNNLFIASGPKNPRTGGVLISQLENKKQLEEILQQDPFYTQNVANYEVIEFTPNKCHPKFAVY